ncbi:MAG: type II toxin-antitoxin system HicB family antitoxin [Candidatus Omnitrophota bacterium]
MKYKVILIESEEGVSVSCPELPGCHSQGETIAEALENIKDAIREWLGAEKEEKEEMKVFRVIEREIML